MHLTAGGRRGFSRADLSRLAGLAPQEAEVRRRVDDLFHFLCRATVMSAQTGVAATMRRRFGAMVDMREEWPEREPPEPCALKAGLRACVSVTPEDRLGDGHAPITPAHAAATSEAS